MRILIIGNTSALGRRLWNSLSNNENEVYLAGRSDNPDIYLDLSFPDFNFEKLPESIDVIIHCAASFKGNSIDEALENELINSLGTYKVLKIAEKTNCKHIIYISSLSIYDHIENDYFGSYGLSKRHGQENLKHYCSISGIMFTALMVSQIYDEKSQFLKHQGMLYRIIEKAYLGQDIDIYGNKDPLRNYLHVIDLINIISSIISFKLQGEFNCLFPRSYKLSEIGTIALSIFNKGGKVNFLRDKADIGSIYIPDDGSLYSYINKPTIDLEQGIRMLKKEYEAREGRS
ncbi:NAD-dependent epimerase/dehydratase family protein [Paenibacillus favisporus]|uniref:NAD-dependent epimerase/dehydratase family protein n=1 Tax=Paenibacillus favisporus TaxID=221028 RepID=UPI003D28BE6C